MSEPRKLPEYLTKCFSSKIKDKIERALDFYRTQYPELALQWSVDVQDTNEEENTGKWILSVEVNREGNIEKNEFIVFRSHNVVGVKHPENVSCIIVKGKFIGITIPLPLLSRSKRGDDFDIRINTIE